MKRTLKYLSLFGIGGVTYVSIEFLYRGHSHWSMFIVGGICFLLIGGVNNWFSWKLPIWVQAIIGAVIITSMEFASGCILNLWLKLNVWDYSNTQFNILGQICLPFSLIWFAIAHLAIVLDDYLRYWLFNEEKPYYTFWFTQ